MQKHKLPEQAQPHEAFYDPVIYAGVMYQAETPFAHIVDNPKTHGRRFFFKPSDRVEKKFLR